MTTIDSRVVAVFGSARVQPTDDEYRQSVAVGRALAEAGYAVITGGYAGVMEAASKGASDAGGHVIGVTINGGGTIGERTVNQWVQDEIPCTTMRERLDYLVAQAEAYIVMPGGIGTLQELIEAWQLMRVRDLAERPLLLYGAFWQPVIDVFTSRNRPFISDYEHGFVQQVAAPQAVVTHLDEWFTQEATRS